MAHTARQLLQEARNTIAATYWIVGDEWKFDVEPCGKFIPIAKDGGTANVIGVCSIGAMSLAVSVIEQTPLDHFGHLIERDYDAFLAGVALCRAIYPRQIVFVEPPEIIAEWNDNQGESGPVIAAFDKALGDTFVDAPEIYTLATRRDGEVKHIAEAYWLDRADAETAVVELKGEIASNDINWGGPYATVVDRLIDMLYESDEDLFVVSMRELIGTPVPA